MPPVHRVLRQPWKCKPGGATLGAVQLAARSHHKGKRHINIFALTQNIDLELDTDFAIALVYGVFLDFHLPSTFICMYLWHTCSAKDVMLLMH